MDEKSQNIHKLDDDVVIKPSTSKIKISSDTKSVISNEMRKLVIRALETGMCSRKSAATTFNLSYTTVASIYNRFLKTGELERKKKEKKPIVKKISVQKVENNIAQNNNTERKKVVRRSSVKKKIREKKPEKIQAEQLNFLIDLLAENCKITLSEMRILLKEKFALDVRIPTISCKLPAFHYNLKRVEDVALTTVTPEIINDHKEYSELFLQLTDSGRTLIYFDETEFHITMKRFAVRSQIGRRAVNVPPPSLRLRNKTILASLSQVGLLYYKALDGPNDRMNLLEYLNGLFGVLSDRYVTGAVLIMGNAAFNYCNAITEVVQLAGHEVVFLPACSAFLNPVENMFSQWSSLIRAKHPISEKDLENLVCSFSGVISAQLCQYYCTHVIENATSCVTGKLIYAK